MTDFARLEEWNPFRETLMNFKLKHGRFLKGPVVGTEDRLLHHGQRGCDAKGKGYTTACGMRFHSLEGFTLPDITHKDWCPDCVKKRKK
jgi:hypothetical protein